MLQHEKNDASERMMMLESEEHVCNGCYDLLTMTYSLKNIAILSEKRTTFRCLLMGTSTNEVLKKLNNSVTYDRRVL